MYTTQRDFWGYVHILLNKGLRLTILQIEALFSRKNKTKIAAIEEFETIRLAFA